MVICVYLSMLTAPVSCLSDPRVRARARDRCCNRVQDLDLQQGSLTSQNAWHPATNAAVPHGKTLMWTENAKRHYKFWLHLTGLFLLCVNVNSLSATHTETDSTPALIILFPCTWTWKLQIEDFRIFTAVKTSILLNFPVMYFKFT